MTSEKKHIQLFEIANATGTDKGHIGPSSVWPATNYADIYQAYFGRKRESTRAICEIGLGVRGPHWDSQIAHGRNKDGGGSIRMWEAFFPNADIYGLDINPAEHLRTERIKTFQVDQSSAESIGDFKSRIGDTSFDIIIDDGSHIADHQQLTISLLWEKLAPGGFYVIEDLNDQEADSTRHRKHAPKSAMSTRRIFQHYLEDGVINKKNAFMGTAFLDEAVYIALHSFPVVQNIKDFAKETVRGLVGRGGKGLLRHQFDPKAPKIVILEKCF